MNRYDPANIRHSVAALICTLLFSTTCLVAAAGPVRAAQPADTSPRMVLPLA